MIVLWWPFSFSTFPFRASRARRFACAVGPTFSRSPDGRTESPPYVRAALPAREQASQKLCPVKSRAAPRTHERTLPFRVFRGRNSFFRVICNDRLSGSTKCLHQRTNPRTHVPLSPLPSITAAGSGAGCACDRYRRPETQWPSCACAPEADPAGPSRAAAPAPRRPQSQ